MIGMLSRKYFRRVFLKNILNIINLKTLSDIIQSILYFANTRYAHIPTRTAMTRR